MPGMRYQPQGLARLNAEYARRIAGGWVGSKYESGQLGPASLTPTAQFSAIRQAILGRQGQALSANAATDTGGIASLTINKAPVKNNFTFVCVLQVRAVSGVGVGARANTDNILLWRNAGNYNVRVNNVTTAGGPMPLNTILNYVLSSTPEGIWVSVNGVEILAAAASASAADMGVPLELFEDSRGGGAMDMDVFLCTLLSSGVSREETRALSANPWKMFLDDADDAYQPAAASSGLAASPGVQDNSAGSGAIGQTHLLAGAPATQSNAGATGAVSETQGLAGAPGSLSNVAGTGTIGQTHVPVGTAAVQANLGATGAVAVSAMAATPGIQQNTAGAGAVSQTHVLGGSAAAQANDAGSGAIAIVADPRYATAATDLAAGPWQPSTGTSLAAMLDEASADATDYIMASSAGACEIGLNPVADPGTSSGQVVRYQAWSATGNGVTVRLKQGATEIAAWTHAALPTDPTIYAQSLSPAQCDSITNYADLRFVFEAF